MAADGNKVSQPNRTPRLQMPAKTPKSQNTNEAYGDQVKCHDEADEFGFDQYANASD